MFQGSRKAFHHLCPICYKAAVWTVVVCRRSMN